MVDDYDESDMEEVIVEAEVSEDDSVWIDFSDDEEVDDDSPVRRLPPPLPWAVSQTACA
jgi:hypothetical protein